MHVFSYDDNIYCTQVTSIAALLRVRRKLSIAERRRPVHVVALDWSLVRPRQLRALFGRDAQTDAYRFVFICDGGHGEHGGCEGACPLRYPHERTWSMHERTRRRVIAALKQRYEHWAHDTFVRSLVGGGAT